MSDDDIVKAEDCFVCKTDSVAPAPGHTLTESGCVIGFVFGVVSVVKGCSKQICPRHEEFITALLKSFDIDMTLDREVVVQSPYVPDKQEAPVVTPRIIFWVPGVAKTNPLNDSLPRSMAAARAIKARHAKERKKALAATRAELRRSGIHPADLIPARVVLRRVSTGKLDRDDGLNASCKWVRDAVAEALGVNDGGPFVRWEYGQRRGRRGQLGVIVRIEREARRGS